LLSAFTKKTKNNEDNTGSMKSQRGVQGEPMMMQSRGSMENSGMKNKSRSPARKVLPLRYHKGNRIKQNQYNND